MLLQARQQEARTGSPTKAKFLKEAEKSTTSTSKAKALTADASVGSLKKAGSGNKVPRMTCFGTSDGPLPEKKPSLAQRYSAWKVSQTIVSTTVFSQQQTDEYTPASSVKTTWMYGFAEIPYRFAGRLLVQPCIEKLQ